MSHPMLPTTTHDERAQQLFLRDLKGFIRSDLDPFRRETADALEAEERRKSNEINEDALRERLFEHDAFRSIVVLQRSSQELLWEAIGDCIDRQITDLNASAIITEPKGSLTLNPDLKHPPYMAAQDTHLMPGGFGADEGEGDVRQGALMDHGGAIYMMGRNGRNGGMMNDGRGHSIVAHLFETYPELQVRRIAELGCGVGNTALSVARYFPDAEFVACDMGPSVLRYAHARAEHLGAPIQFVQANAEDTQLEAGAYDLVYTSVVFHEVSHAAICNIIHEMHRLLRPGGVAINLDVAGRFEELTTWQRISGSLDMDFNNEIGWRDATTADYGAIYKAAGFDDSRVGYQPATEQAEPGVKGFHERGYRGVGAGWFISSAQKTNG